MEKRALLIEWDQHSGKRAGNINPKKDKGLMCYGWQNMDEEPAIELRLVEDSRDLSQYKVEGITILLGTTAINKAIEDNFPSKVSIEDDLIYSEHFKEKVQSKTIVIDDLPNDRIKRLKELKNKYKIKGIKEVEPLKV